MVPGAGQGRRAFWSSLHRSTSHESDGAAICRAGWPADAVSEAVDEGGSNSVVESQPSKLLVAGSIPVSRSSLRRTVAALTASAGQARCGVRESGPTWSGKGGLASPKLRAAERRRSDVAQ